MRSAYPHLLVELLLDNRASDLTTGEADVAVRLFAPQQLDLVATKIGDVPTGLYASRSYLATHGTPRDLDDLITNHALIDFDPRGPLAHGFETVDPRRTNASSFAPFWLSLAFYLFNLITVGLLRGDWLAYLVNLGDVLHLAATAVFGLAWLACRSGRRPAGQLNLFDVGTLVLSVGLFAWKGVVEGGGFQQATVTAMTSLAVIVTHAIIVPATARRAFWVSLIAAVPATVAAYFISDGVARAELVALAATAQKNAAHPSSALELRDRLDDIETSRGWSTREADT